MPVAGITPTNINDYIIGNISENKYSHILLACFPKSGSTFLSRAIAQLDDFEELFMGIGDSRAEQEMNPVSLMLYHNNHYISQQHVRYSKHTARCIKQFHLKPIFLVRNIFDVVVSMNDHWDRESTIGSMQYVPANISEYTREERFTFIIEMVLPWYVNQFMSWTECEYKLLICYEDLIADPLKTIALILGFAGHSIYKEQIEKALNAANSINTRYNVGTPGRGHALSVHQKDKIKQMFSYYDQDFSIIGIKD